ncbi:hypothetical protein DFAR_2300005 [Desulfarculales bacterium]
MKVEDLLAAIEEARPGEDARARRTVERWHPKRVLNLVKRVDDFVFISQLLGWARQDLGLLVEVLGFLLEDDHGRRRGHGADSRDAGHASHLKRGT